MTKQKVSSLKSQLQDLQGNYDQSLQDIHAHRARQEELAGHVEDLVNEMKRKQEARKSLEREFDDAEKTHESELHLERRGARTKILHCVAHSTTSPARNTYFPSVRAT